MSENPTAAALRRNYERAEKAVALMNKNAWAGIRYEAEYPENSPAKIHVQSRPYNDPRGEYTTDYVVQTDITDKVGSRVDYGNYYESRHNGTMTGRVYSKGQLLSRKRDAILAWQRKVEKAREELAAAEKGLANIQEDYRITKGF